MSEANVEFGYTGQIWDKETGLYYYNARFYNPEDGRFISRDSYRGEQKEPGTWHLYSYCDSNPINYIDPSGHKFIYLNATKAAKGYGHSALLIGVNSKWYYYSWDDRGYSGPKAQLKRVKKGVSSKKVTKKVNKAKAIKRKGDSKYNQYIYIKNNAKESYKYAKEIRKGKKYKKYDLYTRNCAWVAIDILRKAKMSDERKSELWKMLYNSRGNRSSRRTIWPNKEIDKVAQIFSTKVKAIK